MYMTNNCTKFREPIQISKRHILEMYFIKPIKEN